MTEQEQIEISDIENETKKLAFAMFLRISEHSFNQDLLGSIILTDLFRALQKGKQKKFLEELPSYTEELEHTPYFRAMLRYLFLFRENWVEGFLQVVGPLSKEQEKIWKTLRLKQLF